MSSNSTVGREVEGPLRASVVAAWLLSCSMTAMADPASRYPVDQPRQPLSDSLRAIARQTGVSVLFDPRMVNGRTAPSLSGEFSGAEAIERSLDGTGLYAEIMSDGSVVVRRVASTPMPQPAPPRASQSSLVEPGAFEASSSLPVRLAQAVAAPADPSAVEPSKAPSSVQPQKLDKVVVTGSRLKRIDSEGPLPVNVYRREDIDRSGQPTLERFLSSLNEASVSSGEGAQAASATVGQGSVQLRGLPLGSTLVLINGRRVQAVGSSSGNFFNLNLIPMAAVDRVEIVPVGSSAIYGGDALAGVVNIILKKSLDGVSLDARLGTGKGLGDQSLSVATGGSDELGSFLLLGAYSRSTPLTMGERSFFRDGDFRRFGGPDTRTQSCAPGTVSSSTSVNLPGLSSPFAGIPRSAAGQPLGVSDFAATAGQANLCSEVANGHGYALVHGSEDYALHAVAERKVSDNWSVFGELTYTRDRLSAQENSLDIGTVVVPAINPYNPFGVPVNVTARLGTENGTTGIVRTTNFTRALIGVRGDLPKGWDFEGTVLSSMDNGARILPNDSMDSDALTAALGATDPAVAFNPFTTGRAAPDSVLRAIWADSVRENHGRRDLASAFVRGPLFELPAGQTQALFGAEFSRDHYQSTQGGPFGFSLDGRRNGSALYGELRAPLMRAGPSSDAGWNIAAVTVAGRRDRYSDFGGSNTYQAGLEMRPARTVLFRGAVATSFKPPTLVQKNVDTTVFHADGFLLDPTRGEAPIFGEAIVRDTNQDLKPEKGRAFSLGALWEPEDGSRFGLTLWRVRIKGLIALLNPQTTLDNEALFPGFVTRGPEVNGAPGLVTSVRFTEVNFGEIDTSGADIEATQSWRTGMGKWTVSASATRTTRYDVVIAPDAPIEDRLGTRSPDFWSPRWKGRVSAGLNTGGWSLGLTSRYLGTYQDSRTTDRTLGGNWVHDLSGGLDLKRLGLKFGDVKDANLLVSVLNLANRQPEFVGTYPYYDATQADWRGRYFTARLSVTW